MKQHITKKQWNELSQENKTKICDWFEKVKEEVLTMDRKNMSIGEMIEFLGDDLYIISRSYVGWEIRLVETRNFLKEELVDALWEDVKNKLQHDTNKTTK